MTNEDLKKQLRSILAVDTDDFWLTLHQRKYTQTIKELMNWELLKNIPESESQLRWFYIQTISFLRYKIENSYQEIKKLHAGHLNFKEFIKKSTSTSETQLHIITYARDLGATDKQLDDDRQAFNRWFDAGAVTERFQEQVSDLEQNLIFMITVFGSVTKSYLSLTEIASSWQTLNLQPFFLTFLNEEHSQHVKSTMINTLIIQVSLLSEHNIELELGADLTEKLIEILNDHTTPYLSTINILEILMVVRPSFCKGYIHSLLEQSDKNESLDTINSDELFTFAACSKIILKQIHKTRLDKILLSKLSEHKYPRVRQSFIESAGENSSSFLRPMLKKRLELEQCNAVRFSLIKVLTRPQFCEDDFAFELMKQTLLGDDVFEVKRLVIESLAQVMLTMQAQHPTPNELFGEFIALLNQALTQTSDIRVKRYITRGREQLASFYQQKLIAEIENKHINEHCFEVLAQDQDTLGRVLSFKAQNSEVFNGTYKAPNWQIITKYKTGRRIWRIVHEFFNPDTDKRQSYVHTKVNKPSAQLFIPSSTVAPVSETNVPGELLFHANEHSTRPYLPLLDYLLSVLSQDNIKTPVKSYSPEGILITHKPTSFFKRALAYAKITWQFKALDALRKGNDEQQRQYLEILTSWGFKFELKSYGQVLDSAFPVEPYLKTLFAKLSFSPVLINVWYSFKDYLYSTYQNTLAQLVFFVVGFIAYFWGRHFYVSKKIVKNRNNIPISIGGWGTRGKSGTERLKSALFSSFALRVVSKTTGCEAMVIYSKSSGEQYELPLFRPFDKASIWEQSDVLAFAKNVKADIFLWECMGLTPRYVTILRKWMRDTFATITNVYPDHEDVLGPSGFNVAREMSSFMGNNTQIFTCEQTMAPILNEEAEKKSTTLIQTHWGDGYQITPDICDLYPFEEHPDNIALVCKMASFIGIDKDYVFRETALRVIPDVGVLNYFKGVKIGNVTQSFVNSMSANERLATLENWQRLNLFEKSMQPEVQAIALINNRNDRVARSKVFAKIMANDLNFDYLVIAGTNTEGFYDYFRQAMQGRIKKISSIAALKTLSQQLKIPLTKTTLLQTLNTICDKSPLTEVDISCKEALETAINLLTDLNDKQQLMILEKYAQFSSVQTYLDNDQLTHNTNALLEVFMPIVQSKCVLIEGKQLTADQLTARVLELALPNQHQLIVGMQNIKGFGLDYVYAWQKWYRTNKVCESLLLPDLPQSEFRKVLMTLAQQNSFHLIELDYIKLTIEKLKHLPNAQNEFAQSELMLLSEKLTKIVFDNDENIKKTSLIRGTFSRLVSSFFEAGAAVKRKKTAIQIYKDISDKRITIERAAIELSKINRDQKLY